MLGSKTVLKTRMIETESSLVERDKFGLCGRYGTDQEWTSKHFYSGIIKLITAVIYGFRNKLECLSLNTRLGWRGLPGTNTLAYYRNHKLRL
jgi:hypothetical protein